MTDVAPLPDDAAAFLTECVGEGWTARALAGDASVRRYFRVTLPDRTTRVLAYYPAEVRAQLRTFLDAYHAVAPCGRIPEVLHYSDDAVLQRDVGDRTLFDLLHEDREEGVRLYREAIDALIDFQRADAGAVNPAFTADFFANELEMTREFYVDKLMGVPPEASARLVPLFRRLATNIARHPYVLCHRDYHGQNIHTINDSLFIIDYQDLRRGPDTYDMASLLRDRGVARILGEATEMELVDYYGARRGADPGLRLRYFETLLQRSIKILGTFSKMPILRGQLHYLDFIEPTLESVRRCIDELRDFEELRRDFPLDLSLDVARERVKGLLHGSTSNHAAAR
jgi:aminoglycoside/choline kinase family phosphotransferase